jgi:hypothetical protein
MLVFSGQGFAFEGADSFCRAISSTPRSNASDDLGRALLPFAWFSHTASRSLGVRLSEPFANNAFQGAISTRYVINDLILLAMRV